MPGVPEGTVRHEVTTGLKETQKEQIVVLELSSGAQKQEYEERHPTPTAMFITGERGNSAPRLACGI